MSMNVKELVEKINSLEITQTEYFDEQSISEEIDKILEESRIVDKVSRDIHRWWETSIVVYKINENEYLGIRYVTNLYSEQSDISDVFHTIKAYVMEPKLTITYIVSM